MKNQMLNVSTNQVPSQGQPLRHRQQPSHPSNLGGHGNKVNLEKRTQFKMDVKTYNYGGYGQFSVFENCKTNPIIPMRVQDETQARRAFGRWQGASEEHTRSGL